MSPLPSIAPRARKFRREKLGELESFDMVNLLSGCGTGRVHGERLLDGKEVYRHLLFVCSVRKAVQTEKLRP
jgi:hypothetical protein